MAWGSTRELAGFGRRALVATMLATVAFSTAGGMVARAFAQAQSYSIPAGPLAGALAAFGRQSGTQIAYDASIASGKTSPGLTGTARREEAITRLLAGTGLRYAFTDPSSILITAGAADAGGRPADGSTALETITVDGDGETAWGRVEGYVARRTATASKTDASLLETPQAVNVVTADQFSDQDAQTLTEVLRYTPGVLGGLEGPSDTRRDPMTVRGFEPVLYVDGMIATSGAGLTAVTKPEPYNLERVEILKGPASVLYGANSPGGLVNIVSKRPTDEARGEVILEGGSYNKFQQQFDVSGPLDEDKTFLYRLVGINRNADTQVDFQPDDHRFLAPSFTWKPDEDTSLTLLGQYSNDDGGVYQSLPLQGTLLPNPFGTLPRHRTGGDKDFDHDLALTLPR